MFGLALPMLELARADEAQQQPNQTEVILARREEPSDRDYAITIFRCFWTLYFGVCLPKNKSRNTLK